MPFLTRTLMKRGSGINWYRQGTLGSDHELSPNPSRVMGWVSLTAGCEALSQPRCLLIAN